MKNSPATPEPRLNARQTKFVAAYVETGNATVAAKLAGYGGNPEVLAATGCRLLKNDKIRRATMAVYASIGVEPAQVLGKLASIAFGPHGLQSQLRALEIMARHMLATKQEIQTDGEIVHDQRCLTKDKAGNVIDLDTARAAHKEREEGT